MGMRRFALVTTLVIALGASAGAARAADGQGELDLGRVRDIVQPSLVFIQTTYAAPVKDTNLKYRGLLFGGDRVSAAFRCTGFFVNPDGYVGTAAHCVLPDATSRGAIIRAAGEEAWKNGVFTSETTLEQAISYAERWFAIAGTVTPTYLVSYQGSSASGDKPVSARRVGYRVFDEGDIGLLKFEAKGIDFPGLELSEGNVEVGTSIVAVGFPGSVDDVTDPDLRNASYKDGKVSSVKTRGGGQVRVYEHSAAVSGGMSGGPVVDGEGRVIGVNSFGIVGETNAFNFSSPVEVLNEVLGDKNVANDVGEVGTTYREGVEALYDEKRGTALDRFEKVTESTGNPAAVLASELRLKAEKLPEDGGFPWWLLLVALAVIGLAAAMIVRRRRRPALFGQPVGPARPVAAVAAPAPPRELAPSKPPAAETQLLPDPTAPALVVVAEDGSAGKRYTLAGEMVIGRENADILLDDEQVSRKHALVTVVAGKVELADAGSANGTFVNDAKVESAVALRAGDVVKVGTTSFRVEVPGAKDTVGGATMVR
jgi:serine protease Do